MLILRSHIHLALADIEHEIEPTGESVAPVRHPHQQFTPEQIVTAIRWLVGEIELRGEEAATRGLNLNVVVSGAARVDLRHYGAKAECTVETGNNVATISKAGAVVLALVISVPEIDHRAAQRPAAARQNKAGEFDCPAAGAGLAQVITLRRTRLKERPLALTYGGFIAVVTGRRRSKFLRQRGIRTGKPPSGDKRARAQ